MKTRKSLALDENAAGITLVYDDWGPETAAQTVICVHGLTRNKSDFDWLAADFAARGARVLAIDMVGRGDSSWLTNPSQYGAVTYARHVQRFHAALGLGKIHWIGTSMGGIVGMLVASAAASIIDRLVLNDVGPFIAQEAIAVIGSYVGLDPAFNTWEEVEAYIRTVHAGFGPLTDSQWQHLAASSTYQLNGVWKLRYDPAIRSAFIEASAVDTDLWDLWHKLTCPTYVLRGEHSAILSEETVARMQTSGPRATVATFAGVGHAPALMSKDQIDTIAGWLGLGRAEERDRP